MVYALDFLTQRPLLEERVFPRLHLLVLRLEEPLDLRLDLRLDPGILMALLISLNNGIIPIGEEKLDLGGIIYDD